MRFSRIFFFDNDFIKREKIDDEDADWRENLYRALYRVVLAGAVCSSAYNELFISALEQNNASIPERIMVDLSKTIPQATVEYLQKFPAYNPDADDMSERGKWKDHEYESIFGTLAQWGFDGGAARSLRKDVRKEDEDCPENSTLREIVHIVSAYEHLSNKI
jgi:hypothetical protein